MISVAAGLYLAVVKAPLLSVAYAEETPEVFPTLARSRDTYYPNTEDLAKDEMRVIACGTGMPTTRAAQAAACFLVELGNGDKFIFDIGSGSAERLSSLQIPYDYLDKIFIGQPAHLALVAQYPPCLPATHPPKDGQRSTGCVGHTRRHHQGPGCQNGDCRRGKCHQRRP